MTGKIKEIIKSEVVLIIAFSAAVVTAFFVPPSLKYIGYIDFKVLAVLFALLAVVSGLKHIGVLKTMAEHFALKAKTKRGIASILVFLSFFSSMLITNDVALIAFVPFTIAVYELTGMKDKLIYTIVLQTAAANLGSMATPIGNPQNLFLFTKYGMQITDFMYTVLPFTLISAILLIIMLLFIKNEPIHINLVEIEQIKDKKKTVIFGFLFTLPVLSVLNILDWRIMLVSEIILFLIFDKKILKYVDYGLLATFICFFIFVGNMKNIPQIAFAVSDIIKGREMISAVIFSQIISNVPAAVFLSEFTDNYKNILIGVNIGGLGTIIASLASLISFKLYIKTDVSNSRKFMFVFTVVNAIMLSVLILSAFIIL